MLRSHNMVNRFNSLDVPDFDTTGDSGIRQSRSLLDVCGSSSLEESISKLLSSSPVPRLSENGIHSLPEYEMDYLSNPNLIDVPLAEELPSALINNQGGLSESNFCDDRKRKSCLSILRIFRYARKRDIFLMVTSLVLALLQGAGFPVSLLIYADILNTMIAHNSCWDVLRNQLKNSSADAFVRPIPSYLQDEGELFDTVGTSCGYLALVGIGIFIFGVLNTSAWLLACERQIYLIRTNLFREMLSKDAAWFDEQNSETLKLKLFDMVKEIENGMNKFNFAVSRLGMALTGLILAFVFDWLVALVICSLASFLLLMIYLTMRLIRRYTTQQEQAYRQAAQLANETIANWQTVVAFNKQEYEVKRYHEGLQAPKKIQTNRMVIVGISQGVIFLSIYLMFAFGFWWGSNEEAVTKGGGTIMQVIICVMIATMSVGNVWPHFPTFAAVLRAADEIFAVIDEKSQIDNFDNTGTWLESLRGDINLEQISFAYPSKPDRPILQSLSLFLPRGKTLALVGPPGCGKTTIVQLLLRYYDVNDGKLTVDNIDIRELNVRWFRQQIGLVLQEPILFNTTIRDNIRMGAVDQAFVSDNDVVKACRLSNAHDFITRLSMGYDTMVGQNGVQLSAGQKQRVAIARAIVSNPKILVLDEATSALDTNSEAIVQKALDKARVGRTTLIIAHRLSTIRNADLIAVMDQGQISEMGTHDQLMALEGRYYDLVEGNQHRVAETGEETPLNGSEVDLTNEMHYINEEDSVASCKTNESLLNSTGGANIHSELVRVNLTNSTKKKPDSQRRPSLGLVAVERGDLVDRVGQNNVRELNHLQIMATVLRWGRPELLLTLVCAFVSVLAGGVHLAYGIVSSEFLSSLCPDGNYNHFLVLALITVGLGVAQVALLTLQYLLFAIIGERLTIRMRCWVLGKILRMDAGWMDREENQMPVLNSILTTDCEKIQSICGIRIGVFLSTALLTGAVVVYSLILDWQVALPLITMMPLILLATVFYNRLSQLAANPDETALSIIAMDALPNIRTVVALASGPYFLEQFSEHLILIRNRTIKLSIKASLLFNFSTSAILWIGTLAFGVGSYLIDQEKSEFWRVIYLYVIITFSVLPYYGFAIFRQSSPVPLEEEGKKGASNILRIISEENTIDTEDPLNGESLAARQLIHDPLFAMRKCSGRIEFRDVTFCYQTRPGIQCLSGVSFTAEPGQFVALCGPTGGGKSTLLYLIQRLYDPRSGTVLLDGVDIRSSNVRWVRGNIGVVATEPVLFSQSISGNVAYGSQTEERPDDDEIEAACRASNAAEFINCLPDRFNTVVGEQGLQLGRGQKQRLAIARALIGNPSVLLVDEATSTLDSSSELIVQEALDAAEEGRTTIVIAERLSTIQKAHKIVVIEHGQVVEQGTHAELMRLRGTYFKLQQFQRNQTAHSA